MPGTPIADRELIGHFIEREVESRTTWSRFSAESGVSRATMYRLKGGDPKVKQGTLRRIERALSLPFDTLTLVGAHRWAELSRQGLNGEVVEWLKQNATIQRKGSSATSASKRSRTPTQQASEQGTV